MDETKKIQPLKKKREERRIRQTNDAGPLCKTVARIPKGPERRKKLRHSRKPLWSVQWSRYPRKTAKSQRRNQSSNQIQRSTTKWSLIPTSHPYLPRHLLQPNVQVSGLMLQVPHPRMADLCDGCSTIVLHRTAVIAVPREKNCWQIYLGRYRSSTKSWTPPCSRTCSPHLSRSSSLNPQRGGEAKQQSWWKASTREKMNWFCTESKAARPFRWAMCPWFGPQDFCSRGAHLHKKLLRNQRKVETRPTEVERHT